MSTDDRMREAFAVWFAAATCKDVEGHENVFYAGWNARAAADAQAAGAGVTRATVGPSLLRQPVKHISELGPCHCPPDRCSAPVIMGRQTPCLRNAPTPLALKPIGEVVIGENLLGDGKGMQVIKWVEDAPPITVGLKLYAAPTAAARAEALSDDDLISIRHDCNEIDGHLDFIEYARAVLAASSPGASTTSMLLFEHEDGRRVASPDNAFTTGDPGWHRLGPVEVRAPEIPDGCGGEAEHA